MRVALWCSGICFDTCDRSWFEHFQTGTEHQCMCDSCALAEQQERWAERLHQSNPACFVFWQWCSSQRWPWWASWTSRAQDALRRSERLWRPNSHKSWRNWMPCWVCVRLTPVTLRTASASLVMRAAVGAKREIRQPCFTWRSTWILQLTGGTYQGERFLLEGFAGLCFT